MNSKVLIFSVVTAHILFLCFDFSKPSPAPPKKSLVVRTYTPPPKILPKSVTPSKPKPSKVAAKPSNQAPQKKAKQPASAKKPTPHPQRLKLLKDLGDTLTRIEATQELASPPSTLSFPKPIETLQVDQNEHSDKEEKDYFLLLASTLKEALELPEVGQVKLELTLLNTGRVQKMRILYSESETNKKYLERQLPFLTFPSFTEKLKNERMHTFTLTFCNEN